MEKIFAVLINIQILKTDKRKIAKNINNIKNLAAP